MSDPEDGFTRTELNDNPILKYFHYSHLPDALQSVSRPFSDLALFIVRGGPRSAERTTALRKLLESKDCAVRAALDG